MPKVVFSKTLSTINWENTRLANDIEREIANLKNQEGQDIIAYGGGMFVSTLIQKNFIMNTNFLSIPLCWVVDCQYSTR